MLVLVKRIHSLYLPLEMLVCLVVNDDNKQRVIEYNLDGVLEVLDSKAQRVVETTVRDIRAAIAIITALTFKLELIPEAQKSKMQAVLASFCRHEDEEVRVQAEIGSLKMSDKKSTNHIAPAADSGSSEKPQIMLSYPWAYKPLMKLVKSWLLAEGYRVCVMSCVHTADVFAVY